MSATQTSTPGPVTHHANMESTDASNSKPRESWENVDPKTPQIAPKDKIAKPTNDGHGPPTSRSGRTVQPPNRLLDELSSPSMNTAGDMVYVEITDDDEQIDNYSENPKRSRGRPKKSKEALKSKEKPETLESVKRERDKLQEEMNNGLRNWEYLENDHADLKKAHKELKNAKAQYVKMYECERKLKVEKGRKSKGLKAQNAEQMRAYAKEKEESSGQFAELEKSFIDAQATISKLTKKNAEDVIPDDVVGAKLDAVESMWRPWAKKWSFASPASCDPAAMRRIIMLGTIDKSNKGFGRATWVMSTKQSLPSILLDTALNHELHDKIFRKPFFASEVFFEHEELTRMFESFLERVQGDQMKAQRWRAQTLELFEVRSLAVSSGSRAEKENKIEVKMNRLYESLVDAFLKGDAAALLRSLNLEETKERWDDLLDIFKQAGNLALRLWKQKTRMDSESVILYGIPFNPSSKNHKAHASMLVDEDNHEYDGHLPDFVVHLPILAWGNGRGENYGEFKIWSSPVVLIFSNQKGNTPAVEEQSLQEDVEIKKESQEGEKGAFAAGPSLVDHIIADLQTETSTGHNINETPLETPRPRKKHKATTEDSISSSLERQAQPFALPKRFNSSPAPDGQTLGKKDRAKPATISPEDARMSSKIKQELLESANLSIIPAQSQLKNRPRLADIPPSSSNVPPATGHTRNQYVQQHLQIQRNPSSKRDFFSLVNDEVKTELTADKKNREMREKKAREEKAAEAEKAAR